jgi:hypothetical protein
MSAAVNYAGDKSRIRSELMTLARAGELTYYGVLGASVGKPARWTLWKTVLDEVSLETPKTDPDITFLVLNASTGWPGQIGFSPTDGKPTPAQMAHAQKELDRVFRRYCPGKQTPVLPQRKRR